MESLLLNQEIFYRELIVQVWAKKGILESQTAYIKVINMKIHSKDRLLMKEKCILKVRIMKTILNLQVDIKHSLNLRTNMWNKKLKEKGKENLIKTEEF